MASLGHLFSRPSKAEPVERTLRVPGGVPDGAATNPALYGTPTGSERRLSIVWACVSLLTQRLQSLPVEVRMADGSVRAAKPPWLEGRLGPWDWDDLLSSVVWSFLLRGNAFLRPKRDGSGRVSYVGVVHPDVVQWVENQNATGLQDGIREGVRVMVSGQPVNDLVHGRWVTEPGNWWGLSPMGAARRTMFAGEAGVDAVARHFSQGTRMQYVLTSKDQIPAAAKREAMALIRAEWSGTENWWRPIMLDGGITPVPLSMTASDADLLSLSIWTDARIAGQIFHVDPTLLGVAQPGSQLTYTNAVDRETNLWRDALRPLAHRVEELFSQLLPAGQRLNIDERGLLTGSPRDRVQQAGQLMAINQQAGQWIFTPDEVRDRAGYPPLSDLMPLVSVPASSDEPTPEGDLG